MIIFSLEGVLADDSHRRHFIDLLMRKAMTNDELWEKMKFLIQYEIVPTWQLDYRAYYDACEKDDPIHATIRLWNNEISLGMLGNHEIWSSRCESVRDKTLEWLNKHLICIEARQLKMRPLGNIEPAYVLKERWLVETLEMIKGKRHCTNAGCNHYQCATPIDFVLDADPDSIAMWRRRGIFCFDCRQE